MRRLHIFGCHMTSNVWCVAASIISLCLYFAFLELRLSNQQKSHDKLYTRNDMLNSPHSLNKKSVYEYNNRRRKVFLKKEISPSKIPKKKAEFTFISDTTEFKKFIEPRSFKVHSIDFNYTIPGKSLCEKYLYLLIICMSEHQHIEERAAIRQTWGNLSSYKTMYGYKLPRIKIVFMFGTSRNSSTGVNIVKEESKQHGDVVIADFEESYHNLTRKVLSSLKWSFKCFKKVKFVLKVDEDTFIHIPNLLQLLQTVQVPTGGVIIGHAEFKHKVLRAGRWPLSESIYPFEEYPPYVSGNSYIISGNIIQRLVTTSQFLPYVYIEDAFITGILREAIGAGLRHRAGFTWWTDRFPRLCSFHNKHRISATNTNPNWTRLLWRALQENLTNCYDPLPLQKLEFLNENKNSHILLENDVHES